MILKNIIISAFLLWYVQMPDLSGSIIKNDGVQGVKLTYIISNVFFGDGKGFDTTSQFIFYKANLILYKIPVQVASKNSLINNGAVISGENTFETRYNYFVTEKGKDFGLLYRNKWDTAFERMPVDSFFLNDGSNFRKCFLQCAMDSSVRLISRNDEKTENGKIVTLEFIPKADSTTTVTTQLYYSTKHFDIPFNICPGPDADKYLQFNKVVADMRSPFYKEHGIDPFRLMILIEDGSNQFQQEDQHYFEKYTHDIRQP